MKQKNSFWNNWIVKNLLRAAILIFALVLIAGISLRIGTRHSSVVSVPDFNGMTPKLAMLAAKKSGIRVDIVDSIYMKGVKRGTVVRQNPVPGASVKKGRRILLTINAVNPKKILMPNLVGYSMRSAKAELHSRGLELGRLMYVSDMATNNVLDQLSEGSSISAGSMVDSGSKIDLILGLSYDDNVTAVPNVLGCGLRKAVDRIQESSLNVGRVRFDGTVHTHTDSLEAVVYAQSPNEACVSTMGRQVSIYLTTDKSKVPAETPQQ